MSSSSCEYKRVSLWDVDDVTHWMKGLNECLCTHVPQFQAHCISGNDLLKLSRQQLEYLRVIEIGHQELLLEAIELLASVDNARSRQSTISLTSVLSKRTSQLLKAINSCQKNNEVDELLNCIEVGVTVVEGAKFLIGWLDRFPTELIEDYESFRSHLLSCCLDLSSNLDSDDLDLNELTNTCSSIIKLTKDLMSPEFFSKPDSVSMVSVTLVPHPIKGLGFSIQRSRRGALVVSHIENDGPSARSGRMYEGVELIQINNQNVVSWEVKNVVKQLKASGSEVTLILRVSDGKISSQPSQPHHNPPDVSPSEIQRKIHQRIPHHLTLERVPSSPAALGGKLKSPQSTDSGLLSKENKEVPSTGGGGGIGSRTHSLSDEPSDTQQQPVVAYQTQIIGGVVHRTKIQQKVDKGTDSGSTHTLERDISPTKKISSEEEETEAVFLEGHSFGGSSPSLSITRKKTDPELLVPCFQLKEPDYEGWVNKLGGSGLTPKNWRKRWFVLKNNKIYYYKSSFDIQALGIINLWGYKVEIAHDIKKKNGFRITKHGARSYYLYTDKTDQMTKWMSVISDSIATAVPPSTVDGSDDSSDINSTVHRTESIDSCEDRLDDR